MMTKHVQAVNMDGGVMDITSDMKMLGLQDGGAPENEIVLQRKSDKNKENVQQIASKRVQKTTEIFTPCLMSKSVIVPFCEYDKNIATKLLTRLRAEMEGKCSKEGYIKPDSIEIVEYSPGVINGSDVKFNVSIQCSVCYPVEGMSMDCTVRNVTKAGVRAEIAKYTQSPMVIFIARDHHYNVDKFADIKEDEIIQVKIIGTRFELNDKYVSVIAELI